MARLTRAQLQELNRAKILAAAREEFSARGYREARIDDIAERAELTRGAVYSNFSGKRALYFSVIADMAANAPRPVSTPDGTVHGAVSAIARSWFGQNPPATTEDKDVAVRLVGDLFAEIAAHETTRTTFAQLHKLQAILLALSLENLSSDLHSGRLVRMAGIVLAHMGGTSHIMTVTPGFLAPEDLIRACEQLAGIDLDDHWEPAEVKAAVRRVDEPWNSPVMLDLVSDQPVALGGDGVVVFLGLKHLESIEDVVRSVSPGVAVSLVLVTGDPEELAPLVQLSLASLGRYLRQAVPPSAWVDLRIVCDETAVVAAAAGLRDVTDDTEVAIRVVGGRIVAMGEGAGAGQAMTALDMASGTVAR